MIPSLACNKSGCSLSGLEFVTLRDKWKRNKSPWWGSRAPEDWNKTLSPHTEHTQLSSSTLPNMPPPHQLHLDLPGMAAACALDRTTEWAISCPHSLVKSSPSFPKIRLWMWARLLLNKPKILSFQPHLTMRCTTEKALSWVVSVVSISLYLTTENELLVGSNLGFFQACVSFSRLSPASVVSLNVPLLSY